MTRLTRLYHNQKNLGGGGYGRLLFGLLPFLIIACSRVDTDPVVVTRLVIVEGQEQIITQIVPRTTTPTPEPVNEIPNRPITLELGFLGDVPNYDPQTTVDEIGIDLVENLFIGLTNFNHIENVIEPELAQSWEVSPDGRVWTFHLREDVYWVRLDQAAVIINGVRQSEAIRPVVAGDMVFSIQRACHRDTGGPDVFLLFLIEGCEQVYATNDPTTTDLDAIGVQALDDFTLQIKLNKPASHFLTITSLWLFHPVPKELVEEFEESWVAPENLFTSGPYTLASNLDSGSRQITLSRNSEWPLVRRGNADVINLFFFDQTLPAFQLWQAKSLDISPMVQGSDRESINDVILQKRQFVVDQTVFYLGYNFDSGVFREDGVRRAFSAAIDREKLVDALYDGQAIGMRHLSPPGVIAAPPIEQIGIGYSPDDARQWLADSGFQSCRLMPPFTFMVTTSDLSLRQAELIKDMWVEELGCAPEQIIIEQVQFGALLANTRRDAGSNRPDIWELAWSSYYPDAQNWIGDLLHCTDGGNRQNRPCSEVDSLIRQTAGTLDAQERTLLFRQIEDRFFGGEGITPLIPLYIRGEEILVQAWLKNYTPALFGGEQYDSYIIQADEKELERSR